MRNLKSNEAAALKKLKETLERDPKFVQMKLSDYLGKWVVLCFYPGDFTFV